MHICYPKLVIIKSRLILGALPVAISYQRERFGARGINIPVFKMGS